MKLRLLTLTTALLHIFLTAATAQTFLTNGLVAYYPFNGNANDASGNGNNGTVNGATLTQDRFGVTNAAYSFNGVNNYISFAGVPTSQIDNWTMTAWLKPASLNQSEVAVGLGYDDGSTGNGYSLGMNTSSQFDSLFGGLGDNPSGFTVPSTNQWYQVVVLRSSGVTQFYVNGVQTPNSTPTSPLTPTAFRIGSNIGVRLFNGAIDDVRIYNRALSSNEVAQLYDYESTPPNSFFTNGLVAYYPFNGNANDASGNGNNGTAMNGVSYIASPLGSSASFNGSSQYIVLPNTISNYEDLSVTFWLNTSDYTLNGFPYGEFLVSRDIAGYAYDWNICLEQGRKVDFVTDADELVTPFDLNSNSWIQVACVADSIRQQKLLFVNGQQVASASWPPFIFANNTVPIFLGASTVDTASHAYFTGGLADVSFYNRALSSNDVAQLYAYESGSNTNPPSITSQPPPVTLNAGGNASFTVTTTGALPLNYQWSLNGTNIPGATAATLTISNVSQTDLGAYAVVVSNPFGSTNSSDAMLSMYPFIETPFTGAITDWGQDTTLSLEGWGTGPLSYQWFKDGVAVINATNQTLFLPGIQFTNAGLYSIVLLSPLGSVTNIPAQVVVNPAGVSIGMYPGVTVSGVVGYTYTIQASSDLTNTNGWTTTATLTLIQPVQLWVDISVNALSPANPHKYYRVVPGG